MKLRAGLLHVSSAWEQMFQQEGFPFAALDFHQLTPDQWSVVVINRSPVGGEVSALADYLRAGGSILTCHGYGQPVLGTSAYHSRIRYLTSRRGEQFEDVGLLDVGAGCTISREANLLRTETGNRAVFAGECQGGFVVDLPFDPSYLMFDSRTAIRLFPASGDRLPSEVVSFVSKGPLRLLFRKTLEFLHHARGLPYAHLWYFPDGVKNCFAFRIDTDGAPRSDVDELYGLSVRHEIPFSWYLDVQSHREWLGAFRTMKNQELGVHCYEHRTFESSEENAANIRRALTLMTDQGLPAQGFTAPYGQWNAGLAEAIDELEFLYSSEFAYAYDTLPFYPQLHEKRCSAMQVPIHPVCIGSMRSVGYTAAQMTGYFLNSIDKKLCMNEPLFYYHHPAHGHTDVVQAMLAAIQLPGIVSTTLGDFARWWKVREAVQLEIETEGVTTILRPDSAVTPDPRCWVEVTLSEGVSRKAPLNLGVIKRGEGVWENICRTEPHDDSGQIRDFDLRATIAYWFNTLLRKVR